MNEKPYNARPGTFPENKEIDNDRVSREDSISQWYNEAGEMMLTYARRKAENECSDLISREAAVRLIREKADGYKASHFASSHEHIKVREMTLDCAAKIENLPAVDAVSHGVLEQVKWERDTAISQLKEIGIGFGQKKPDMVEVVRCKDCVHYRPWLFGDKICGMLGSYYGKKQPDDYCSRGRKHK